MCDYVSAMTDRPVRGALYRFFVAPTDGTPKTIWDKLAWVLMILGFGIAGYLRHRN